MRTLPLALALSAVPALADVPNVVADIGPVQGLAARVMDGVGAPAVLIRAGSSPHSYALRPSEAAALEGADVVFWVGHGLTPWLEEPVEQLAGAATVVELSQITGVLILHFREIVEEDDHGDHDDHDEAHDGHDHVGEDPHLWLDPDNAALWLDVIAAELSRIDPDNAATYRANADAGRAEIAAALTGARAALAPLTDRPYLVFHDAYQYFEGPVGLAPVAALALPDASAPSAARLAEVRDTVIETGIVCAFAEPQFNTDLLETAIEGTGAQIGVLDPLGSDIPAGPGFYPAFLDRLASDMAACLRE